MFREEDQKRAYKQVDNRKEEGDERLPPSTIKGREIGRRAVPTLVDHCIVGDDLFSEGGKKG